MKGNFKATAALTLLDKSKVPAQHVQKFGAIVVGQFVEIARTDRMNTRRAILFGFGAHVMKNSLPRGQFEPWKKAIVTGSNIPWSETTVRKNTSVYMRMAIAFLEAAKPPQTEVLALTAGEAITGKIEQADSPAVALLKRLDEFCGDMSIAEFCEAHGINDGNSAGGGSSAAGADTAVPADDNTLLQDTQDWIMNLRQTLLRPDTMKRFPAKTLDDIEAQLASALTEFRKLKAKLRK